ncbi:hypothetical protein [Curtobacterium sp. MCBD17_040]|uniref:hypothetical protein n=1 Tax=Curtobacterium sp. MCBD17_040 TaxID=2175674 RepID=UPI0015E8B114|nr:hypothetical protein [Curtobacterium sp. MCBD17_040]WIB65858.1 hypothetical protein DEI94_17235 [Curtobacterium sp. MCBD17_040]
MDRWLVYIGLRRVGQFVAAGDLWLPESAAGALAAVASWDAAVLLATGAFVGGVA